MQTHKRHSRRAKRGASKSYRKGSKSKTMKGKKDFTTKKSSKVFNRKGHYEKHAKGSRKLRRPYIKGGGQWPSNGQLEWETFEERNALDRPHMKGGVKSLYELTPGQIKASRQVLNEERNSNPQQRPHELLLSGSMRGHMARLGLNE